MNLEYLIGSSIVNRKKETGNVTNVVDEGGNASLFVTLDNGRTAEFKFCSSTGKYVTDFLTFTDEEVSNRLTADIESDKQIRAEEKAQKIKQILSAPAPAPTVSASPINSLATYGDNVIYFGRNRDAYKEFSNFNGPLDYDGRHYKCSEAAWQSLKTMDPAVRDEFSNLAGSAAKSKGRSVKLRPDWEAVKYNLMVDVCYEKFKQNVAYKELLLGTGEATLVENTTGWHDNYWGCCNCAKCQNIPGQNHLGLALMEVRDRLRAEENQA